MTKNQYKKWIPETYLLASSIYYWILTGTLLNPVAVGLLVVLGALIVFKNRALGVVIGGLLLLLNLYLVLAMLSELNEFPVFNDKAWELAVFGTLYLGTNIIVSVALLIKWGAPPVSAELNVTTADSTAV